MEVARKIDTLMLYLSHLIFLKNVTRVSIVTENRPPVTLAIDISLPEATLKYAYFLNLNASLIPL